MKFFYLFSPFLFIAGLAHGEIRIGGSDLLAEHFGPALVAYADSRDLDAQVDFLGSYPGLEGVKNGSLDLAVVAIPDGMEVPEGELRAEYIGAQVLAVAVAEGNPLSQINLRQLAGVFGDSEAVNITRWGELGLAGEWSTRSIAAGTVSASEHTLAVDLFRHSVLSSRRIRGNVAQFDDLEGIRRRFQAENDGIALLHRVPTDARGFKILSIARDDTDLAQSPSPSNVASNQYSLRLPLYLVFPKAKEGELKDFLRYIVSEEAAEALEQSYLVPLPDSERDRLGFEFERL